MIIGIGTPYGEYLKQSDIKIEGSDAYKLIILNECPEEGKKGFLFLNECREKEIFITEEEYERRKKE